MNLLAILGFFALLAQAEPGAARRPDSRMFSCADATAIVQQNGAVVFQYGPGLYHRVVANESYCMREERIVPLYLPTLDEESCHIGQLCVPTRNH
jgi:hypothetical protein